MIRPVLAVLVFVMVVSVIVTVVAASTILGTVSVSATVTIVAFPIPADLDGDGCVGQENLSIVARSVGGFDQSPEEAGAADVNGDSQVDVLDVALVGAGFGTGTCP